MTGGRLTTHALDTVAGTPAALLRIDCYRLTDAERVLVGNLTTNADGRTDTDVVAGADFAAGEYELVFHVGAYLARVHGMQKGGKFLHRVPVRFLVQDANAHYHVPLLFSHFSYATYRGS